MTSLQNFDGVRQGMFEGESLAEVPEIIHYCWFDGRELSKLAKKTRLCGSVLPRLRDSLL